jgi:hypothetical protein
MSKFIQFFVFCLFLVETLTETLCQLRAQSEIYVFSPGQNIVVYTKTVEEQVLYFLEQKKTEAKLLMCILYILLLFLNKTLLLNAMCQMQNLNKVKKKYKFHLTQKPTLTHL